ncbi:hypothetical protein JXD38_07885 [candidate division WOR-3 bacterium]|nr:hypothetical protein [candidate division WOR-3 bacterium]
MTGLGGYVSQSNNSSSADASGISIRVYQDGSGESYGGEFLVAGNEGTGPYYGIYSEVGGGGSPQYAGYFDGDVHVNGTLSKTSGSFLIDHPLDPLNKTLRHNFVESPENLCVYRGKVILDANGRGTVDMPSYFAALTKEEEATAVLTPIGRPFVTGYEWNSSFDMLTVYGDAGREVSYLVMADRDDPAMRALRRPVEEKKGPNGFKRGRLMQPEAYGYPETMGYRYEHGVRREQRQSARSSQDE